MLMYDYPHTVLVEACVLKLCLCSLASTKDQVNRQREKEKREREAVRDFSSAAFLKHSC